MSAKPVYPTLESNDGRLLLWGNRAALEVSMPFTGVIRFRHRPASSETNEIHPIFEQKDSPAISWSGEPIPLCFDYSNDQYARAKSDPISVTINRHDGSWSALTADGSTIARLVEQESRIKFDHTGMIFETSVNLEAAAGEAYLGLGEKTGPINKRGLSFIFWNTDIVPYHIDSDPLYLSIPFFIAVRPDYVWGCFLNESWRTEVDLAKSDPGQIRWSSSGPEMDLYLFGGPTLRDVVQQYTQLTGRTPLPPLWSLGAQQNRWGYEKAEDVLRVIQGYRNHGLPLDAIYMDLDHMVANKAWTWNRDVYSDPAELVKQAAAQGVKLVPIVNPGIKVESGYPVYDEAVKRNYLIATDRGVPLQGEVFPNPVVFPDLLREEVQTWWGDLHNDFITAGIAGFWNDMNEPSNFSISGSKHSAVKTEDNGLGKVEGKNLPYDARHGKKRHLEVHNLYGLCMCKSSFEAVRRFVPEKRPFVLTRAGFAGSQRYGPVWTGDISSSWSHLSTSISMLVGLGLSGMPFCGADVGGFHCDTTGELLVRWYQLAAFYPFLRNHSHKMSVRQEPWQFGEPFLTYVKEALDLRYRLLPTLYTLMFEAATTGHPVIRPLAYVKADEESLLSDDAFLFGESVLVAPITHANASRRSVYLPPGEWLEYPNLSESLLPRKGGQFVALEASLNCVMTYVRSGGLVALTRSTSHTTTANWQHIEWHINPSPRVEGVLYEDEGEGFGEHRITRVIGESRGDQIVIQRVTEGSFPSVRESEEIHLLGLKRASSIEGSISHEQRGDKLVIQVPIDWTELKVATEAREQT
jgi:alpha-glucosidase